MNQANLADDRERERKEKQKIKRTQVMLTRSDLVQALNVAADVMRNTAAVARSSAWQEHYRASMAKYSAAATLLASGARFAIKDEREK